MVSVRATGSGDWALVRDVRLAALRDAPGAFASTYEREAAYTEEQWRGWFSDRFAMFLAHLQDRAEPAGLAGVFDAGDGAGLVSMWVRPDARGRGVGEALMNAAAGWAKDRGHDAMYLWVAEANEPARRLYERYGFTPTGDRQPLPSNPGVPEIRMRLGLLLRSSTIWPGSAPRVLTGRRFLLLSVLHEESASLTSVLGTRSISAGLHRLLPVPSTRYA